MNKCQTSLLHLMDWGHREYTSFIFGLSFFQKHVFIYYFPLALYVPQRAFQILIFLSLPYVSQSTTIYFLFCFFFLFPFLKVLLFINNWWFILPLLIYHLMNFIHIKYSNNLSKYKMLFPETFFPLIINYFSRNFFPILLSFIYPIFLHLSFL